MTAALAAVLVLLNRAATTADMLTFPFKVAGMTAGAIWRVRYFIGIVVTVDACTDRSFVTAGTARVTSVIARVVTTAGMREVGRCPA